MLGGAAGGAGATGGLGCGAAGGLGVMAGGRRQARATLPMLQFRLQPDSRYLYNDGAQVAGRTYLLQC